MAEPTHWIAKVNGNNFSDEDSPIDKEIKELLARGDPEQLQLEAKERSELEWLTKNSTGAD